MATDIFFMVPTSVSFYNSIIIYVSQSNQGRVASTDVDIFFYFKVSKVTAIPCKCGKDAASRQEIVVEHAESESLGAGGGGPVTLVVGSTPLAIP
jgi:hypothetical protein